RASSTKPPRVQTAALASTDACNEERACRAPGSQATSGFPAASDRFRARRPASGLGGLLQTMPLFGFVQAVDDLVADELLGREQLVSERDDQVPVVVEERMHVGPGLIEQPLDGRARILVGEHLADDPLVDRTGLDRLE